MNTITDEDDHTLEDRLDEFTTETDTSMVRSTRGRFAKGNKEGRKFQKGYSGKPQGSRNRKTLLAREFAEDVLYLNPQTGKQMTYHELCLWVKKKADNSPRILNLLLDHALGKPVELVQHQQVVFIMEPKEENKALEAEVIGVEQLSLPEGSEEEEGQELV